MFFRKSEAEAMLGQEAAEPTVAMVRPEDRQPCPCVALVPRSKVSEWSAAGWVQREAPDQPTAPASAPMPEGE